MSWLADILYILAGVAYLPVAVYNALFLGKNRRGWRERFGFVRPCDSHRKRLWIHAVSLGEINATPKLVTMLRERLPGWDIVVSTTTDTGFARAVQLYGRESVFRFPLDFSLVISRVFERVRPTAIVLVELEVWYNLVTLAARRGIPVIVVNGRLTERSARRFRLLGPIARRMFSKLTWVCAQDKTIAGRFRLLGVPAERIEVTSSLKWDSASVSDRVEGTDALAATLGLRETDRVWVCGSTGPGEEEIVLDAYARIHTVDSVSRGEHRSEARIATESEASHGLKPSAQQHRIVLVIVPRKPERFGEVAALIEQKGYVCVRRSLRPDDAPISGSTRESTGNPIQAGALILGDTMGELRKFYSLAHAVFVGRSLVPLGGSDPMEAAALGKAITIGPHFENFDSAVRAFLQADALRIVRSGAELADVTRCLLSDPEATTSMGLRARRIVLENQGATERTGRRIVGLLGMESSAGGFSAVDTCQTVASGTAS